MKIEPGTKVKIVNYGHPYWTNKTQWKNMQEAGLVDGDSPENILEETDDMWCSDMMPELVGQEGVVNTIIASQGRLQISLDEIKGKSSWYNLEQIEVI